jgi:hypothetical protein
MRDIRDAKAMAQTIREAFASRGLKITVAESLELMAKAFGVLDWNTLSASIKAAGAEPDQSQASSSAPVEDTLVEFRKVGTNVAESDQGFTVRAGYNIEYAEEGVTTKIDAEHSPWGAIALHLQIDGPSAVPDGRRIYDNVFRALKYLGRQPELWAKVDKPPRDLGLTPNPPETAPRDGCFILCDFRDETRERQRKTYWAVAWDNAASAWITRFGRVVEPAWRMEAWGLELDPATFGAPH